MESVHVLFEQLGLTIREWLRRRGHVLRRQCCARALQCAVDRRHGHLQRLRDLLGGPAEHFAQKERGTLTGRQVLQCRDKREPRALPEGHRLKWVRIGRQKARVGQRLEPMRPRLRFELVVDSSDRALFNRTRPSSAGRKRINTDVCGDLVQPGAKRRPAVEATQRLPRANHRFLDGILGVERRAEHSVAMSG